MLHPSRHSFAYLGVLAGALVLALAASWTPLGIQVDNSVYDWIFRLHPPQTAQTESIVLAIDEPSLSQFGGAPGVRRALAEGLERIAQASPKAVAIDVTLADAVDRELDRGLTSAFRVTPNLILPCDLLPSGRGWEDPIPQFRRPAVAVGHVHADLSSDGVSRAIPLEMAAGHDRRWALSLEAFRASRHAAILESPQDLQVAGVIIPSAWSSGRTMRVRFRPPDMAIPRVSIKELHEQPALAQRFAGKVVFAGVTALTLARDRLPTPYSSIPMPGVEIHANAFETIAHGWFLTNAPAWWVLAFCMVLVAAAGATFRWLSGWMANAAAVGILAAAHAVPYAAFTRSIVFPFSPGVSSAWLSIVAAAAWQHLYVRRRMVKSEAERDRYQHAMHFVTHEMRTPLTAIQGSSELMSRYPLTDEKRQQIALLIHSESKRLGRMIEMFLNVERLSAGEMELKKETFSARDVMMSCVERARPLAERKQIQMTMESLADHPLKGDRELMEYAFYNVLTNAIKYSPARTQVTVSGGRNGDRFAVSVRDQGMGMDQKEVRKIFQKFYRTKKAEQSGEAGTGIGLSIVEQIVIQHGGRIEVETAPGKGSCFTLILPAEQAAHRPLVAN
jgi:signal transduction histidine kinase